MNNNKNQIKGRKPRPVGGKGKYKPAAWKNAECDDARKVYDRKTHGGNDASWYAKNPQLLLDACNYPFSEVLGNKFTLSGNEQMSSGIAGPIYSDDLPGILVFPVCPLPGNAQETNDPVNLAARAIYGFVRHANSGSKVYDIPDIMLYLLGMDSLYSKFSYLRRVYGIISYYETKNRYTGRALVTAMGVDYDDILQHLSDFRQYINTFALKTGALVVPKDMSYFLRHMWMYENVYRDAEHAKSQFYMYTPEYFYKYVETGSNPGSLEPCSFLGYHRSKQASDVGLKTYVDLIEETNEMIDAMMESEDCGIISGDILKAFGDGNVWHLTSTSEDFHIEPIWNQEVLTQFHNIETLTNGVCWINNAVQYDYREYSPADPLVHEVRNKVPATFGTVSQTIVNPNLAPVLTVDNNYNELLPQVMSGYSQDHVLDLPYSDVSPANAMVATRCKFNKFSSTYTSIIGAYNNHVVTSCGSEVIARMEMWDYIDVGNGPELYVGFCGTELLNLMYDASAANILEDRAKTVLQWLMHLERWDYHPLIFPVNYNLDVNQTPSVFVQGHLAGMAGDLDNYTKVSSDSLRRTHEVALLSQFDTPQAATWSLK